VWGGGEEEGGGVDEGRGGVSRDEWWGKGEWGVGGEVE